MHLLNKQFRNIVIITIHTIRIKAILHFCSIPPRCIEGLSKVSSLSLNAPSLNENGRRRGKGRGKTSRTLLRGRNHIYNTFIVDTTPMRRGHNLRKMGVGRGKTVHKLYASAVRMPIMQALKPLGRLSRMCLAQ